MKRSYYLIGIILFLTSQAFGQAPTITTRSWIANGFNLDATVAHGKIYLISNTYYELDLEGNMTYSNTNIDDTGQGTYTFCPTLGVGADSVVHVITRDGGNGSNGYNLMYSRRDADGTWSVEDHLVRTPVARNYVVDIVPMDGGEAVYAHAQQTTTDVWGSVFFYKLNGTSVTPWGDFGTSSYYRVDVDFRMDRYQNRMHLGTGKPDPWGYVFYMNADISSSLGSDLASSVSVVKEGTNRKGLPDLSIDKTGNVFMTHGDYHELDFEKYTSGGSHVITNKVVLSNLGSWHLDLGMGALAVSDTGDTILVVGLKTGGHEDVATNCALRYTYSFDGGVTWSTPTDIPDRRTNSGEGRSRPRLSYYKHKFYLFYNDNAGGGIGMSTFQFGEGPPPPPPVELVDPVDLSLAKLSDGNNFDVEVANQRIYLISDQYYEYNLEGEMYAENTNVVDAEQGDLEFSPALAVGSGGEVHVITRNGGSPATGFNLYYSNKLANDSWAVEANSLGTPVERNYVVDVVDLDGGTALYAHSSKEDEDYFGSVFFNHIDGTTVSSLGDLGRNDLYRANSDFKMERNQTNLHLVTGKPDADGAVYYMEGKIGASLTSELTTDIETHMAGEGVKGMPDIHMDDNGNAFITYGSSEKILFNRYSHNGATDIMDKAIYDHLGGWKHDFGLSAIESSPDGDTLLAVGLKTDGSDAASNCTLYYSYSLDGGIHWVYPIEIPGFNTNSGEGRKRPKIRYYSGRFYIFFNNLSGGIAVKTISLAGESPIKTSTPVVLPAQDSVTSEELISIESADSDAIYYSFTDPNPGMLSQEYTGPFTIYSDTTIYAVAYRSGYLPSNVLTDTKKLKGVPPPPVDLPDPIDLSIDMLAGGENFDVEVANDRIYLISDHYYEFDLEGTSIADNELIIDERQSTYDFSPAISVGQDGIVHVVTRQNSTVEKSYHLKYSKKRTGSAIWTVNNNQVGGPTFRNYVVDVVALNGGEALYAHSQQTTEDVWGSVFFYTLNGLSVNPLGDFNQDIFYRIDSDFRMERYQNRLHLASGKPDSDGAVYYMNAEISSSLPTDLAASSKSLLAGNGRRGMPDLRIDDPGNVFITYGAEQTVFFRKYSHDDQGDILDVPLFNDLGTWHLDLGLSAMAASPGGDTLLAVALKTDDTKLASNSALFYTYSFDGGENWVYPIELSGFQTDAGEGRMRPRIKYYRERFYIFFNNVNGGISVKTIDLRGVGATLTAAPLIMPDQDTVAVSDEISMQAASSDAIFYSLGDASVDMFSTRYTTPFYLEEGSTVYARAYRSGYYPSDVVSRTYIMDVTPPLPDPVDLTKEKLCEGVNFDVEIANDKIHVISDHYYEFDLTGELLEEESSIIDLGQGTFDFGPAIAVGEGGVVHLITRGAGEGIGGFDLKYSKKMPNGVWPIDNKIVGTKVARNYVVDLVALDNGKALYSHSQQTTEDVWSSVFFYTLDGDAVESMGDLGTADYYRTDADYRMERFGEKLHLATGRPDPDGAVHYMSATIGPDMPLDLAASQTALVAGEGRRGQPDLRIDDSGNVFITYGAQEAVYFNRYSTDGSGDVTDQALLSQLGSWHLELGLSAIASTGSGDTLLVVGLETDGSKEASSCKLLFTYSFDGGRNWVYPNEIEGFRTNGREGRMRPRVKFYRGRFYIFYNNVDGGIAVTTINLGGVMMLQADAPVILPTSDSVYSHESITLMGVNNDAIFYSFTDPEPDIASTFYDAPFNIDEARTIYARAYRSGYLPSDVVSATKQVIITSDRQPEGENSDILQLYPVPASGILSVKSVSDFTGDVYIRVYNHAGELLSLDLVRKPFKELSHEIDVSDWPGGMYLMLIQSGQNRMTRKFIVE